MKAPDVEFAALAFARGLLSREARDLVLVEADRCQALGLEKSADEILLERQELTLAEVRSLREALGWTLRSPRIGDYDILRRIGIGGMGTVFEARHVRLKQRVALKVLFPRLALDRRFRQRFLREARTLARLSHPHLVHAIDAGRDGSYWYMTLEFIEGENLLQILTRERVLDPLRSLEIVRAVCGALGALEEKGLVHCDVKPANILLGPGTVKLADLGLLQAVRQGGGAGGLICGTPHYLSPEQACGRADLDSRSDLYSLAASWFHMLAGQPPFLGGSTREIVQAHAEKPPPPLSAFGAGAPPPMESTIQRWLAKEPGGRPRNSRAALEELEALSLLLDPRRERVHPPALTGPPESRRLRGRRVKRALLVGCPALLLLSGVGLLVLFLSRGRLEDVATEPSPAGSSPLAAIAALRGAPVARIENAPEEGGVRAPPAAPEANGTSGSAPVSVPPRIAAEPEPAPAAPRPPEAPGEEGGANGGRPGAPAPEPEALRAFLEELRGAVETKAPEGKAGSPPGELSEPAPLLRTLRPLAGSFHAKLAALEPDAEEAWTIVLAYEFESPPELQDFRGRPGAWEVRAGSLHSLARPAGEPLDSVAWFVPPLRVEGELSSAAPLALGFGDLRVAPGRGADRRIWLDSQGLSGGKRLDGEVPAPLPQAEEKFAVTFHRGEVEVAAGAGTFKGAAPVPEKGRFLLQLPPGASLRWLKLNGSLQPTWAKERLRLLQDPAK